MKNKPLFDRTILILVKAYHNETLVATSCQACAVGNLVTANLGLKYEGFYMFGDPIIKDLDYYNPRLNPGYWYKAISEGIVSDEDIDTGVLFQLNSIGYDAYQVRDIESSFMNGVGPGDDNFNGLMSVVDTLMVIHEANETEVKQAKDLFVLA